MNALLLILISYPNGLFGPGPASSSDAGMMLEQGVFAVDYNPSGLAWLDTLEVGVAAEGFFRYNLLGAAYRYRDWATSASVHKGDTNWGFSAGSGYLFHPMAVGVAFSASFDTTRHENTFSLRSGLQWRNYVGLCVTPKLWRDRRMTSSDTFDTFHIRVLNQIGVSIPTIEGLDVLMGGSFETGPPEFTIGGGVAYEPLPGVKVQSYISLEHWGAALLLGTQNDHGGLWVRRGISEPDTFWSIGLAYVRSVHRIPVRLDTVFRNIPERVDTVYITHEIATPENNDTTRVSSPDVRKEQEKLMIRADQLYAAERYQEAIDTWRQVVKLDPSSDLAARARQDIEEVTALLETLERIRQGKKPQ